MLSFFFCLVSAVFVVFPESWKLINDISRLTNANASIIKSVKTYKSPRKVCNQFFCCLSVFCFFFFVVSFLRFILIVNVTTKHHNETKLVKNFNSLEKNLSLINVVILNHKTKGPYIIPRSLSHLRANIPYFHYTSLKKRKTCTPPPT